MTDNAQPIPTLAQFIGDGQYAEGFENFSDYTRSVISGYEGVTTPEQKILVSFIRAMSIVMVEVSNQWRDKVTVDILLHAASIAAGHTVATALISAIQDETAAVNVSVDDLSEFVKSSIGQGVDEALKSLRKHKEAP